MAKYIDADALMDSIYGRQIAIKYNCCGVELHAQGLSTADIFGIIEGLPAADVEPVRHGTWERYKGYSKLNGWSDNFRCSACREFRFHNGELRRYKYCPECGAKMDGGESNG